MKNIHVHYYISFFNNYCGKTKRKLIENVWVEMFGQEEILHSCNYYCHVSFLAFTVMQHT